MTLAEYLNQTDPKRYPDVKLKASELHFWGGGYGCQLVSFDDSILPLCESDNAREVAKQMIGTCYAIKPDSSRLFTTDSDSNPRKESCFRLIPDIKP